MNKRKKSSTGFVRVGATPRPQFDDVYSSPETLTHLRNCEAREWIRRYKDKAAQVGSTQARAWWNGVCDDIERRRGKAALDDLKARMNKEKANV